MIIAVLFIYLVLALLAYLMVEFEDKDYRALCFFLLLVVLISYTMVVKSATQDIPAIEVYRGNTTLQVTYQDGVPVDSVVVLKKK